MDNKLFAREEVLPALSETKADILIESRGSQNWFTFVEETSPRYLCCVCGNEDCLPDLLDSKFELPSVVSRVSNPRPWNEREVCRINISGKSGMLYVRVAKPTKFIKECSDLRYVYNRFIRFVQYDSLWWLPAALEWVKDCRAFMFKYGTDNTPWDIIRSFDDIERRLFNKTIFPGEKLRGGSPTGVYMVVFGTLNTKITSFTLSAQFCYCDACMEAHLPSFDMAMEIHIALHPNTDSQLREAAKRKISAGIASCSGNAKLVGEKPGDEQLYVKHGLPWHSADDGFRPHSKKSPFKHAGMHIVHWFCHDNERYDHAVFVGPLFEHKYLPTIAKVRELGITPDGYTFVRNDLEERGFHAY